MGEHMKYVPYFAFSLKGVIHEFSCDLTYYPWNMFLCRLQIYFHRNTPPKDNLYLKEKTAFYGWVIHEEK